MRGNDQSSLVSHLQCSKPIPACVGIENVLVIEGYTTTHINEAPAMILVLVHVL